VIDAPEADAPSVAGLDDVLAPDGWPYASAPPTDPDDPGRFHRLFGRDSLITALEVLPERPDVARATLRALARLQGTRDDPVWDEEPGKIVHEVRDTPPAGATRFLGLEWPTGELRYYGSADATSWFLYVLAATGDRALADELRAAWERAGDWLLGALERGGGLVRFGPRPVSGGGLGQQGWRDADSPLNDTGGGILHEDGSVPPWPVADADTQAAAVAGLRGLAALSQSDAHARAARELTARLAARFGPETMAIDGEDREVRGAGSQLGWLLWAGVPVPGAAERLAEPDVLTGFGLRTLSDRHRQFAPRAYHRGAVWPFDSWLAWGGLRAAGHPDTAERVRAGVLAAIARLGRYPELYAVTGAGPERVPIANQVQAWTVGAVSALRAGWDGRTAALTETAATG
jgi:glycogen debranching enzyme